MSKESIYKKISDAVLIGSYEEVNNLELSTITRNSADNTRLNGLVIKGYETKFGGTNENGERYTRECLDKFIEEYFVKNKLNIPVTLMHGGSFADLVGRVLVCEVNTTGFYFVAYIPKTLSIYPDIVTALKEGLLQGFSKEGWATDYEPHYNAQGVWEYDTIKEMKLLGVSLVSCPANGIVFEKTQEVADATQFRKESNKKSDFAKMFN